MSTKAMIRLLSFGSLVLTLAALTQPASAQPTGPQQNLDSRFRNQVYNLTPDQRLSDALMSGQGDLMLMQHTKLFTAHIGYARSTTSNAKLSPDDPVDDAYGVTDAGLEAATQIGGHVRVYASASLVSAGYARNPDLDYSAVTGAVGLAAHYAGMDLNLSYGPATIYGANFRHRNLTQNRFDASLSSDLHLGRVTIQPSLGYDQTRANPSDYDNSSSGGRLTVVVPFKTKHPLTVFLSGGYTQRIYDHYFPDLLGVTRKDKLNDFTAGARWQITDALEISAQYSNQRNRSTSDVNFYKARGGTIGLSLHRRF